MVSRSGFQGSPWADLGPTCLSPSSPMAAAPTAGKPILSLASRVNIRGSRRVYAHSTLLTFSMFNRCSFCICLLKYFRRLLNHQNVGIRGEAKNPPSVSWRYKLCVSDIKGLIYGMTFMYTIALCGYPHVKVSIRDLSQISTAAPIFQLYIYFRQNLEENVTFTFFFLVLPQISLVKYYETIKILMQIFVYFKLHFHDEGLDC